MAAPQISVIMATYNRSNILGYSIASLRRSTFTDWELIVVGDGCTDDSAAVVASFGDGRIRFVNRAANYGEQSGPNNDGFAMARGRYIAYLNHDDLYFSDHLATSLQVLQASGADLVFAATAAPAQRKAAELGAAASRFSILGVSPTGLYEPYIFAPASAWLLDRRLIEAIGPWRAAVDCVIESSQDFLFRAWKAHRRLVFKPLVTVLAVQSGSRKNVYRNRETHENEYYAGQLRDNANFREEILSHAAMALAGQAALPKVHFNLTRGLRKLIYRPALRFGLHPRATKALLKGHGRGWMIGNLRRLRGLDALTTRNAADPKGTAVYDATNDS